MLIDHEGQPAWRSRLKSIERGEPADGKPVWIETHVDRQRMPLIEETVEPPTKLVARIQDEGLMFGGTWTWALEPHDGGTAVTITEDGFVKSKPMRAAARLFPMTAGAESFLKDLALHLGSSVKPEVLRAR